MWKSFFLAIGISMVIVGVEMLMVDTVVLAARRKPASSAFGTAAPATKEVTPAEWLPWSLMSGGVVVMIYSYSISKIVSD